MVRSRPALAAEDDNLVLRAARGAGNAAGARRRGDDHADQEPAGRLRHRRRLGGRGRGAARVCAVVELGVARTSCNASRRHWARTCRLRREPAVLDGRARRDRLSVIPIFPALHAVLVNPGIAVSTAEVFQVFEAGNGTELRHPATISATKTGCSRSSKPPATICKTRQCGLSPGLCDVMSALCEQDAVLLARMSGSGATCFGLCGSAETAREIAQKIANGHPRWWVKAVRLGNG